ncbi:hypothetical protein GN958_ATG16003 [Phytophthora infestans]|uniref:Uncharacterized protein n=1 Tax=Phytophthora infestans TaxID=4787 RepID=A0A8S9U5P3_PHYIN|nr:hypothetical protein GN958_ATG17627 [Phytophthora infestans]KAF4134747.1 hypothetical protein GN958_ATG16003 [Phytophthora infestans]
MRMLEQRKDVELYTAYLTEIGSNFSSVESVLAAKGVESMHEGVVKSVVNSSDGTAKYFQYRRKTVFLLDADNLCHSVWKLTQLRYQLQDRQVCAASSSDSSYAVKFRFIKKLSASSSASIVHRLVLRRYVIKGGVIIMVKAFIEGDDAFKGMNSSESGWIRLRQSNAGTVMDMYMNQVPVCLNTVQSCDPRVAQFVETVIDFGQDNEQHVIGGIASLSLDDDRNSLERSKLTELTERLSLQQLKVE